MRPMPADGPDVIEVAPPTPSNPPASLGGTGFPPPLRSDFTEGFTTTTAENKAPAQKARPSSPDLARSRPISPWCTIIRFAAPRPEKWT